MIKNRGKKVSDNHYLVLFILVASLATFATRALPFIFFSKQGNKPFLQHLAKNLPAAVMVLLSILFLFPMAHWGAPIYGLNALIPSLLVVLAHKLFNNAFLSIIVGTGAYMAMQQLWVVNFI